MLDRGGKHFYFPGNCVALYDKHAASKLWAKTTWLGTAPPFTWALAFSGDSQRLAIGHWGAFAYIICIKDFSQIAALKRDDRVYAIDLDVGGQRLVVAGRDKTAAVYVATSNLDQPYELMYEAHAKAFASFPVFGEVKVHLCPWSS